MAKQSTYPVFHLLEKVRELRRRKKLLAQMLQNALQRRDIEAKLGTMKQISQDELIETEEDYEEHQALLYKRANLKRIIDKHVESIRIEKVNSIQIDTEN